VTRTEKKDEKQAEKAVGRSVYRLRNREKEGEVAEGADSTARPSSKGRQTIECYKDSLNPARLPSSGARLQSSTPSSPTIEI
jgi:hypothetical protein